MKPAAAAVAAAAALAAALVALGACKHDRERTGATASAPHVPPEVTATPRARPAELGHLTLKVLGMT